MKHSFQHLMTQVLLSTLILPLSTLSSTHLRYSQAALCEKFDALQFEEQSLPVISTAAQKPAGTAARIVVIKPKEGLQQQFEQGYRRHLDWHRQNKDPWVWYGWQIISGERVGYFMDGTFGRAWTDFDAAVSPAADAADNAANVVPYGDFLSLAHYVLLPQVSQSRLLEERRPPPFIETVYYHLYVGKEAEFESLLRKAHEAHRKTQPARSYAWYKLVSGGSQPMYLLMLPHNKWSDLQASEKSFTAVLEEVYPQSEARRLLASLSAAVREMRSETLRYRVDLSYFPP
jgi:hypothetical protein